MTRHKVGTRLPGRMAWVLSLNSISETLALSGKGGPAISAGTVRLQARPWRPVSACALPSLGRPFASISGVSGRGSRPGAAEAGSDPATRSARRLGRAGRWASPEFLREARPGGWVVSSGFRGQGSAVPASVGQRQVLLHTLDGTYLN